MDKHNTHSALDDYFASMLSIPAADDVPPTQSVALVSELKQPELNNPGSELEQLKPLLSVVAPSVTSDYKFPEPDASGSLNELDLLLGSVVDIDLADIDLSALDNTPSVDLASAPAVAEPHVDIAAAEVITPVVSPQQFDSSAQAIITTAEDAIVTVETENIATTEIETELAVIAEPEVVAELESSVEAQPEWQNVDLEERFQALFFEVAGVTFAVPLTELGGIHQQDTINSLFGKPDWYLGIMQHREQKLSVVDTAQWVMPEQNMGEIEYKYQIQLSESNWVLGCESLHGTETLSSNDIKWRSTPGSRPWLAGMVKSRMCVLLHVTEMIKLLDNGINIHGQ